MRIIDAGCLSFQLQSSELLSQASSGKKAQAGFKQNRHKFLRTRKLNLKMKRVLVTGGYKGIGFAKRKGSSGRKAASGEEDLRGDFK